MTLWQLMYELEAEKMDTQKKALSLEELKAALESEARRMVQAKEEEIKELRYHLYCRDKTIESLTDKNEELKKALRTANNMVNERLVTISEQNKLIEKRIEKLKEITGCSDYDVDDWGDDDWDNWGDNDWGDDDWDDYEGEDDWGWGDNYSEEVSPDENDKKEV